MRKPTKKVYCVSLVVRGTVWDADNRKRENLTKKALTKGIKDLFEYQKDDFGGDTEMSHLRITDVTKDTGKLAHLVVTK